MVSLIPFIVISNMDIQVNTPGIEFSLHPGLPHEKLQFAETRRLLFYHLQNGEKCTTDFTVTYKPARVKSRAQCLKHGAKWISAILEYGLPRWP